MSAEQSGAPVRPEQTDIRSPPLARPHRHQPRRRADHRRLDDRQRGDPVDRRRPRHHLHPGAVGAGATPSCSPRCCWCSAPSPTGSDDDGCCSSASSIFALSSIMAAPRSDRASSHRLAGHPGRRRRHDPADDALAHQCDLPGPGARHRLRRLGIDDRRHGRRRPTARRLAHHRYSWRWAFGINVPLGILIVVGASSVTESQAAHPSRVDVVGAVLSVITSASLVFGLIEGRTYGWWRRRRRLDHRRLDLAVRRLAHPLRLRHRPRRPSPPSSRGACGGNGSGRSTMLAFSLFRIDVVPQRQHRRAHRLARRVRHHPVAAAVAAERPRLRRPADRVRAAGARDRLVRREWCAGAFGNRFAPVWIVRAGILFEIIGLGARALVISRTPRGGRS